MEKTASAFYNLFTKIAMSNGVIIICEMALSAGERQPCEQPSGPFQVKLSSVS